MDELEWRVRFIAMEIDGLVGTILLWILSVPYRHNYDVVVLFVIPWIFMHFIAILARQDIVNHSKKG